MSGEVKSFDSLDSYLLYRIQQWEQENPRPDCPQALEQSASTPEAFMVLAHNAQGYVSGYPTSPGTLQIKCHVQKKDKSLFLAFSRDELETLIEALLIFQSDMDAYYEWNQSAAAQELHRWKTQRGMRLSEWKREYQELAEGGL